MAEKSEEGNDQSIKGHYAYIMSNGIKRRVDYVADNQGFHLIRDNADPARIKRSVEPDFIKTRMTSVMDSSSLKDNGRDMYKMSNMLGGDMSSSMGQRKYSNMMMHRYMMGQESMDHQMMGQNSMGRNMMGRNVYNIMSNRGMASNMMGQQMGSNMMGSDMTVDVMGRNMMDMSNDPLSSNNMNGLVMKSNMNSNNR